MKLRSFRTAAAVLAFSLAACASVAGAKTTNTHASLTLVAPAHAVRRARIAVRATSVFSVVANGAEHLTVFITPPGVSCPKTVRPPRGARRLLSGEPADRVLIAKAISDPLSRRGTWTVCGYLTYGRLITAAARARVRVG